MKHIQLFKKKTIERTNGIPYLVRWNLFGLGEDSKFFSIKVHKILVSDDECLHDHPWWFISFILKGGYREYRYADPSKKASQILCDKTLTFSHYKDYKPGTILLRPAHFAHRLEVNKPCWTLVITFKKIRTWGFFTRSGWKHWTAYNKSTDC